PQPRRTVGPSQGKSPPARRTRKPWLPAYSSCGLTRRLPEEASPMWQRMKRVFRSMFGWMISAAEDPELILEQNIRDLNDQVPKMNESIAMVKANVTLLEKENQKYRNDVIELTSKVKAAIQAGRDDIATTYATQLQTVKSALARNDQQLSGARQAFDKAMQGMKIEEEAEKIRANELLKQFKQEMGLESPASAPEGQKTLGSREGVKS